MIVGGVVSTTNRNCMKSIVGTGVAVFVVVDDNWTLIVDSP